MSSDVLVSFEIVGTVGSRSVPSPGGLSESWGRVSSSKFSRGACISGVRGMTMFLDDIEQRAGVGFSWTTVKNTRYVLEDI